MAMVQTYVAPTPASGTVAVLPGESCTTPPAAVILELGIGFTVIVTASDVAVAAVTQISEDGVITTVTASRFFKLDVVKVLAVCPVTFTVLVCHW